MKKVTTRYSDGTYTILEWTGVGPYVEITDDVWRLYCIHMQQDNLWHGIARDIDNHIFEQENA